MTTEAALSKLKKHFKIAKREPYKFSFFFTSTLSSFNSIVFIYKWFGLIHLTNYLCNVKTVTLILAIFILALSGQTCCVDDNCDDSSTASKTEQEHHKDSCDGTCSPFFSCGTCVGFTFPTANFSVPENNFTFIETHLVSTYIPQLLSQFNPAIWQPPKIS